MPTANEQILDAFIRHQIGLLRYSERTSRAIIRLLNESEKDLRATLERRLKFMAGRGLDAEDFTSERMIALLAAIAEVRTETIRAATGELRREMRELVKAEAAFAALTVEASVPVVLSLVRPAAADLLALVTHRPFEGKTLSEWAESVRQSDIARIDRAVKIGLIQGESIPNIVRRVLGTQALRGRDGVLQSTRNDVTTIVRTAVNSYSNAARQLMFEANRDVFDWEQFVATLDARTTILCASLDGKRFKRGEGPIPPLHMRCRSLRVAVVTLDLIGERPMKPFTEQMLLREFAAERKIPVVSKRARLPHGYKIDFDKFARARGRELTGRIPARVTFEEWLKRQPMEFKRDYLGADRAKLFASGEMSLQELLDVSGRPLSLEKLAKIDAAAFKAAGVDLGKFN